MFRLVNQTLVPTRSALSYGKFMSTNNPGSTGNAGAIREAGGVFGRMEMAREEQYFYNQQKEEMKGLKETLKQVQEAVHPKTEQQQQQSVATSNTNQSHQKQD